jgi:hypothetical protein
MRKFFVVDPDPGSRAFLILDPGYGMEKKLEFPHWKIQEKTLDTRGPYVGCYTVAKEPVSC